jgi:NADH dehydrogenase/NADH:ubiquinone oxidoreductase subunit G
MFKTIITATKRPAIELHVDGRPIEAHEGDTLAIALLSAGIAAFRHTPVSGEPRAPLCLMGVCFDCLVEVDGRQNVQSCMIEARPGMKVRLPTGARRAEESA